MIPLKNLLNGTGRKSLGRSNKALLRGYEVSEESPRLDFAIV
jgi:hypothetical protein